MPLWPAGAVSTPKWQRSQASAPYAESSSQVAVDVRVDPIVGALDRYLEQNSQTLLHDAPDRVKAAQERLCPRDTHANQHMADNIVISHHNGYADVGPAAAFWWARMVEVGGATNRRPRAFVRPSATG